jgi:hypothetical protein
VSTLTGLMRNIALFTDGAGVMSLQKPLGDAFGVKGMLAWQTSKLLLALRRFEADNTRGVVTVIRLRKRNNF